MKGVGLILSYNNQIIGTLDVDRESNDLNFKYDQKWITHGFSISPQLPLDNIEMQQKNISIFIENLLPEEENREILAKIAGISRTSIFGLIRKIGIETTGAILFSEVFPITQNSSKFRPITSHELESRLLEDSNESLIIWDGKPRLSIAGVQRKLPVTIINGEMGLGDGTLCSTHILKFQKLSMADQSIVLNEFFCMKLARLCDIPVADVEYQKTGQYPYLLVKRFDRKEVSSTVVNRIHVIDGCQAMNLPVSHKYERPYGSEGEIQSYREGANFNKLFYVLDQCRVPLIAKRNVIRWIIFNLIVGNSDFHAKNISFFINDKGMELAPFYDIVNTDVYSEKFNTDFALSFGDEFKLSDVGAYQVAQFCADLGIKRQLFRNEMIQIARQVITHASSIHPHDTQLSEQEVNFLAELKKTITRRAEYFISEMQQLLSVQLVN